MSAPVIHVGGQPLDADEVVQLAGNAGVTVDLLAEAIRSSEAVGTDFERAYALGVIAALASDHVIRVWSSVELLARISAAALVPSLSAEQRAVVLAAVAADQQYETGDAS